MLRIELVVAAEGEHDAGVDSLAAARAAVQQLGLRGRLTLLSTGENEVYACGEVVLRVTAAEVDVPARLAAVEWLRGHGIPMPNPVSETLILCGAQVVAWERVSAPRADQLDYRAFGEIIARVHTVPISEAPVPLSKCTDAGWLDLDERLEAASRSSVATGADIAVLSSAIENVAAWRSMADRAAPVLCHGDAHPLNVLMRSDEVVVADWDSLCIGPPAWDHAPLLTWAERWGGHATAYRDFAAGYGQDLSDTTLAKTIARVRLIGPTLTMIIRGDTSPQHAAEARRRMQYWHSQPDAPTWTPQ